MRNTGISIDTGQIRDLPLFEGLDQQSIEQIACDGWMVDYKRASRVLERGDFLDGLLIVIDGGLKLYMLSCNGSERVLRVMQQGDSFGEAIMFNRMPSPVYVDALSDARLAFFPRDVITTALTRDPEFTNTMLSSMSMLMRNLINDLETCCMLNALQRTVGYLVRASGKCVPLNELVLPAPKAVVASTLNLSPETFSRELHRLQDDGLIAIERRRIRILDRDQLVAMDEGVSQAPVLASRAN